MEIIDILESYIKQENTDFAILINGTWGSGKTYFIKNELGDRVVKHMCDVDGKQEPYSLVYVSLYGLSSVNELEKRLFLEVNPKMKTKGAQLGGFLLNKIGSAFSVTVDDEDKKDLLNIFGGISKNKILVFDDLERLSDEILDEVLGFINSYTEHQGLKVIIIADENKIKEKVKNYNEVKEKLIRFTYSYKPELTKIFAEFIKRYSGIDFQEFLLTQQNLICQTFEKGEHQNLRTLRFILDLYYPIYQYVNQIKNIEKYNKERILTLLLYFLVTYSIEYKRGNNNEFLPLLKTLSDTIRAGGFGFSFSKHFFESESTDAQIIPQAEDQTFTSTFENRYIENSNISFRYYDFLAEFIHTGNLDSVLLEEVCIEYNKSEEASKDDPAYIHLNHLQNCLLLEDADFRDVYKGVLHYVDEGSYDLKEYQNIFEILFNCQINKIEGIVVDISTLERFKNGMQKSLSHSDYKPNIRSPRHFIESPQLLQDIRNYTIELNNSLLDSKMGAYAQECLLLLKAGDIAKLDLYLDKDEIKGYSIFQENLIDANEFVDAYFNLDNKNKKKLQETIVTFFYPATMDDDAFTKMKSFLEKTHDLISQQLPTGDSEYTISLINARDLSLTIKSIIDNRHR
jgi:hypothetical protein